MTGRPALIVLAGGRSARMGRPKHTLRVGGARILDRIHRRLGARFAETLVVGGDGVTAPTGARYVPDRWLDHGPLGGIATGLSAMRAELALVVACDMPDIRPGLVDLLLSYGDGVDAVVPVVRGYDEPLLAVYHRRCLEPAARLLGAGIRPVRALYDTVAVHRVPDRDLRRVDPDLRSFTNLNCPADAGVAVAPGRLHADP
ncbi:MAG: molybdenum cofactor guanylyltransferase [Candidatus Bipolaricaulota bacterium]|nr:MAG: molybdenum cofactor guanylyltransferase [Candidatus Bipolaricaulota bacterium]